MLEAVIQDLIRLAAPSNESGPYNGHKVAEWMGRVLERPVAAQRGWEYLKQMEYRLRVLRPAHIQADLDELHILTTSGYCCSQLPNTASVWTAQRLSVKA